MPDKIANTKQAKLKREKQLRKKQTARRNKLLDPLDGK